jgi:hypothetical protein
MYSVHSVHYRHREEHLEWFESAKIIYLKEKAKSCNGNDYVNKKNRILDISKFEK